MPKLIELKSNFSNVIKRIKRKLVFLKYRLFPIYIYPSNKNWSFLSKTIIVLRRNSLFRGDVTSSNNNESDIFRRWKSNLKWRMFHRLNDKGDNSLTEIPGCPKKRIMGKRKLDFSSPSQSKLTKLSAFGFSSANSSNVVSETSSSPKPSSSNKVHLVLM